MERRLETPRGLGTITTIGAFIVALLIAAVIALLIEGRPLG